MSLEAAPPAFWDIALPQTTQSKIAITPERFPEPIEPAVLRDRFLLPRGLQIVIRSKALSVGLMEISPTAMVNPIRQPMLHSWVMLSPQTHREISFSPGRPGALRSRQSLRSRSSPLTARPSGRSRAAITKQRRCCVSAAKIWIRPLTQ